MKIDKNISEILIKKEIGDRIHDRRIAMDMTQLEFSQKCGLSLSTVIRIENGDDTKFSNIIKIMRCFDAISNLDLLIPEQEEDYKALFENKAPKKRVRKSKDEPKRKWIWGDEK